MDATVMFRTAATKKGLTFNEDTTNLYQGEVLGDLPRIRQVLLKYVTAVQDGASVLIVPPASWPIPSSSPNKASSLCAYAKMKRRRLQSGSAL